MKKFSRKTWLFVRIGSIFLGLGVILVILKPVLAGNDENALLFGIVLILTGNALIIYGVIRFIKKRMNNLK